MSRGGAEEGGGGVRSKNKTRQNRENYLCQTFRNGLDVLLR